MTEPIRRKLPCSDNGDLLPWDAVDYQNRDNAAIVGLWNWATYWVELTGVNDLIADTGLTADPVSVLKQGMNFIGIAPADSTGAMTVAVDTATTVDLLSENGDPLGDGAVLGGSLIRMVFDGTDCRLIVGGSGGSFGSGSPDLFAVDEKASGTNGGDFNSGADRVRLLNAVRFNDIAGASVNTSTGDFTLPAGEWWVVFAAPGYQVNNHQAKLFCVTDNAVVPNGLGSTERSSGSDNTQTSSLGAVKLSIGSAKTYRILHRCETTQAVDGFGEAGGFGNVEIYTRLLVWKVGAQESEIIGYPGGPIVIQYLAELGSTTNADPGPGRVKFNNATQNAATRLYADLLNAGLVDVTNLIDNNFAASSSTVKGQLTGYVDGDPSKFITYNVTALTTQAGWREITVAATAWSAASPFAQDDKINWQFTRTGDIGATGADGGAFRYLWDTSTSMADPGTGDVRGNNASLASITSIAISNGSADAGNPDVSDLIATWDDSSTTANRGTLLIKKIGAPQNFVALEVNGAITDNGAWLQIPVASINSGGAFANADALSITFFRSGDAGAGSAATDAEMEAAASLTAFVTPGRQQRHPSAAKFWGHVTVSGGAPTLANGWNVAAIVDTATGRLGVTIGTDMSSASYQTNISVERASTSTGASNRRNVSIRPGSQAAGSIEYWCFDGSDVDADPAAWHFAGHGDE